MIVTSGTGLLPGFYGMHEHMKASLAYALLVDPNNMVQVKVTIPEGWRPCWTPRGIAG